MTQECPDLDHRRLAASASTCRTSCCGSSSSAQAGDLPDAARRPGPAGGVRRGRPGPGPGHAEGERGDEDHCRVISEEFSSGELPACRWAGRAARCCTTWACAPAWTTCARLAAILIQADRFGSSIAQALRVQSDSMRTRRRQLAEEKAAKTAVQADLPAGAVHLPRHLRGAGRPGGDHHRPRHVPHDERNLAGSGSRRLVPALSAGF